MGTEYFAMTVTVTISFVLGAFLFEVTSTFKISMASRCRLGKKFDVVDEITPKFMQLIVRST